MCAHFAHAQTTPQRHLSDADSVRSALDRPVFTVQIDGVDRDASLRAQVLDGGFRAFDGDATGTWLAGDEDQPFAARMLAAMFASGPLTDTVAALGFRLSETSITIGFDADVMCRRIGGHHASVAVELDTSRLRAIRIVSGDRTFVAEVLAYGAHGNGWFPTDVAVSLNDSEVVRARVVDVARAVADLAPLPEPPPPPRDPFPRLPL